MLLKKKPCKEIQAQWKGKERELNALHSALPQYTQELWEISDGRLTLEKAGKLEKILSALSGIGEISKVYDKAKKVKIGYTITAFYPNVDSDEILARGLERAGPKIKELAEKKKEAERVIKELQKRALTGFNTSYSALGEASRRTADLGLLRSKREEADEAFRIYFALTHPTKISYDDSESSYREYKKSWKAAEKKSARLPKRIKTYISNYAERASLAGSLKEIDEMFRAEANNKGKDRGGLQELMGDCDELAKSFERADYIEGVLEVSLLKKSMGDYLEGVEREKEVERIFVSKPISDSLKSVDTSARAEMGGEVGYSHLIPLPEPRQDSPLYPMWEVYIGKNKAGWVERLMLLDELARKTKLNSETEVQYTKKIKENLNGFSRNGYLSIEMNNRTEARDAAERAFHSLDALIDKSEKRIGSAGAQRAYAYVNA